MNLRMDVSEAACIGHDPTFWFPEESGPKLSQYHEMTAKAICNDCPIQAQCLEMAMSSNEKWGIWGGLMPAERQALRRRRR